MYVKPKQLGNPSASSKLFNRLYTTSFSANANHSKLNITFLYLYALVKQCIEFDNVLYNIFISYSNICVIFMICLIFSSQLPLRALIYLRFSFV